MKHHHFKSHHVTEKLRSVFFKKAPATQFLSTEVKENHAVFTFVGDSTTLYNQLKQTLKFVKLSYYQISSENLPAGQSCLKLGISMNAEAELAKMDTLLKSTYNIPDINQQPQTSSNLQQSYAHVEPTRERKRYC